MNQVHARASETFGSPAAILWFSPHCLPAEELALGEFRETVRAHARAANSEDR